MSNFQNKLSECLQLDIDEANKFAFLVTKNLLCNYVIFCENEHFGNIEQTFNVLKSLLRHEFLSRDENIEFIFANSPVIDSYGTFYASLTLCAMVSLYEYVEFSCDHDFIHIQTIFEQLFDLIEIFSAYLEVINYKNHNEIIDELTNHTFLTIDTYLLLAKNKTFIEIEILAEKVNTSTIQYGENLIGQKLI